MKAHLATALRTFVKGCDRAAALRAMFEYLNANGPRALDCDDILRSSVILGVSSFDLLIHDLYRTEAIYRLRAKREVSLLRVSFSSLVADEYAQATLVEQSIRAENSYKSFVAPDKVADILRHLTSEPWAKIAAKLGKPVADCKAELKRVVDLRNRIAHEADVNPAFGGIELWPIYSADVAAAIEFLRTLGEGVTHVIEEA